MTTVVIDGRPCLRGMTGIPAYAASLVRTLPAADPARTYRVFSWRRQVPRVREMFSVEVVSSLVPGRILERVQQAGASVPRWRLGRVDIFHGTSFDTLRVRGARTIATIYDVGFLRVPECYDAGARHSFDHAIRSSRKRADHFVTLTEHARGDVIDAYGLAPDFVSVIPPAFDRMSVPGDPAASQTCPERDPGGEDGPSQPYVLYVGEIGPRKNLVRLIEGFASIAATVPHNLVVAGPAGQDAEYPLRLLELAARLQLEGRVRLTGPVPSAQLRQLYGGCDAFCFPSLHEGFGFPPLEAMAFGKPTLTSTATCLPEVVGDAALLVDPWSSEAIGVGMLRLLTDDELRHRLAAAGPRRAAYFDAARMVAAATAVYDRLL